MSLIVGVHGIGQQFKGPQTIREEWYPALCDGIRLAGGQAPGIEEFRCAFYGDLFRELHVALGRLPAGPAKSGKSGPEPDLPASWQLEPEEMAFVEAFAAAARLRTEEMEPSTLQGVKKGTLGTGVALALKHLGLDNALRWLTRRPWFGSLLPAAILTDIKQVRAYLCDKPTGIRMDARQRVMEVIQREQPRVVVAHSLGSVVAWEALCALPGHGIEMLVTIGSPLGMKEVVHSRLAPKPVNGRAAWPGVQRWVNLAEAGDIVAAEPHLKERFSCSPNGVGIVDVPVSNGTSDPHSALHYLTASATGQAIAEGGGLIQ